MKNVICPLCGGDGKETCTNPDHVFLSAFGFTDIGRIGCPCCGHDPHHKIKNGGKCELCNGNGDLPESDAQLWADENGYDEPLEYK